MGTDTVLTLTATPVVGVSSYSWELPEGVTQLSGGTSNVITVKFKGVTNSNTHNYSTTAGVSTNVLRIGVKSVNGVGVSTTANTALANPQTTSTAKLLTLTAVAPAASSTLVLTDPTSSTPATAVAVVSKYVGTSKTFKLTAGTSALASSYLWVLPSGVNRTNVEGVAVTGLTSNDPFIYVNFADVVPVGTTTMSLVFEVKAVNGITSSSTKSLTVTAGLPTAITVTGTLSVCNRSQGYDYVITVPGGATKYSITAPVGSVVTSSNGVVGATPNKLTTTDLTFNVVYSGTAAFSSTDKALVIKSENLFGPLATAKSITLTKASCPTVRLEMVSSEALKVVTYPNPFANNFNLNVTTSSSENVEMRVYDMIGKLVETRQFSTTEANNQEIGNSYPTGIYNVIVTQGEEMKTIRVIKK
jgi:hypothetical protein